MSPTDRRFWSAFFAAMIFLSYSAAADECDTLQDPEPRIVACTQSINSGKWKGHNQAVNYTSRGNGYRDKGELDHAIADYSEAIRLDPKVAIGLYNRGIVWRAKGDIGRAIADYSEAIRLDPTYVLALNNRGLAYHDTG